jgi:hypothetical protein
MKFTVSGTARDHLIAAGSVKVDSPRWNLTRLSYHAPRFGAKSLLFAFFFPPLRLPSPRPKRSRRPHEVAMSASEQPRLPDNSPGLRAARFNLRNIRIALARPERHNFRYFRASAAAAVVARGPLDPEIRACGVPPGVVATTFIFVSRPSRPKPQ